jgi:hypothetical protein
MKLMILVLVTSLTPLATAASHTIKKEDLNRVSLSCAHKETAKLKKQCLKKINRLKKDLNRVKLDTKGVMRG